MQRCKLEPSDDKQAYMNLLELLGALPRDCLAAFRSEGFKVNRNAWDILLRIQPHLVDLAVLLDRDERRGLPSINLVRGKLTKLQSLWLDVEGNTKQLYREISAWFQHAPALQNLHISRLDPDLSSIWNSPVQAPLLNLQSLSLFGLDVSDSVTGIVTALRLPRLQALKIIDCSNAKQLLQLFAEGFKECSSSSLKSFIYNNYMFEDAWAAVTELFKSTKGLINVVIKDEQGRNPPELRDLSLHADSLQELQLTFGLKGSGCSIRDVEYLAANCKSLERLVIRLDSLHQVVNNLAILERFDLSTSRKYSRSLVSSSEMVHIQYID